MSGKDPKLKRRKYRLRTIEAGLVENMAAAPGKSGKKESKDSPSVKQTEIHFSLLAHQSLVPPTIFRLLILGRMNKITNLTLLWKNKNREKPEYIFSSSWRN